MNIVNDSHLISLPTSNIPIWNEKNQIGKCGSCLLKLKNINFRILHRFLGRFDIRESMIYKYEYTTPKTGIADRLGGRIKYNADQPSTKICPLRFTGNISRRDEIIIRNIVRSIEEKIEEYK